MKTRLALIVIGIVLLIFSLFLTVSIVLYSLKERDNSGYYYLFFSVSLLILGLLIIRKAK